MSETKTAIGPEYTKIHLNSVIEIGRIVSLHYFKYIKDFWGEGEAHDFWELVYVDAGEIEIIAGEEHFTLAQGQCFLHPPLEYHNVIAKGSFASVFITSFECFSSGIRLLGHLPLQLDETQQHIIACIFSEGQNAYQGPFDLIARPMLTRSKHAAYGAEQMVKTYLEQLVITLVRNQTEQIQPEGAEPRPFRGGSPGQNRTRIIDTILAILAENLDQELSLDAICQRVAFSRSYLERLFYEEMNCGIKQYFTRMKVERAKELISEQSYSFTEIAAMLGFNSIHYFSRTFQKFTGMTPTQYQHSVLTRKLL